MVLVCLCVSLPTWWRSAPKMAQPVRTPVAQRRLWGPKAWFTSCLAVAITSSSSAAGTGTGTAVEEELTPCFDY